LAFEGLTLAELQDLHAKVKAAYIRSLTAETYTREDQITNRAKVKDLREELNALGDEIASRGEGEQTNFGLASFGDP
jgi:hypothetical protein